MSINENQLQFIINCDVENIVGRLHADEGMSMTAAFERIYNSRTYRKLTDTNTGLYLRSADYIYDRLMEETK